MIVENIVVGIYDGAVNTNGIVLDFNESEFKASGTYPIFADSNSFGKRDFVQVVGKARLRFDHKTKELIATNVVIYDELNVDTTAKFLCTGGNSYPSDNQIFDYTVTGLFFSTAPLDLRIREFSSEIAESSEIEIIMPAKDIPNGSKVRKITGTHLYTIWNSVTADGKIVHKSPDKVFLFGDRANINSFNKNKKLVWIVEKDILKRFLK